MALGNCRECGKEVSDDAKICPNCGIKTPIRKSVTLIQAVIVIFIGAWIISKMGGMLGVEHTASTTTATTQQAKNSIPNVPKKDGTYDARTNDLEELCRDYIFFRNRIIKYAREGDEKAANKARADFQQTNRWLEAYNEKDMNDMFTRIGGIK